MTTPAPRDTHAATRLVGTAGWALTRETAHCFPTQGTVLQRYAATFGAVEINSSFYRPTKAPPTRAGPPACRRTSASRSSCRAPSRITRG